MTNSNNASRLVTNIQSAAVALCFALGIGWAAAQEYPNKSIRIVVGFPPGGSNDVVARILAPKLAEILAVRVVVENKPSANATIATDFVARG